MLLAKKTSYKPFTIFRNKSFISRRFLQQKHIYFNRLFLNDNTKRIVYWAVHFLDAVHNMLIYEWNSYSVLLWKHYMNECVDKRNEIFHFTELIVRQFMISIKIVYIRIGLHYMLGDSLRTSSVWKVWCDFNYINVSWCSWKMNSNMNLNLKYKNLEMKKPKILPIDARSLSIRTTMIWIVILIACIKKIVLSFNQSYREVRYDYFFLQNCSWNFFAFKYKQFHWKTFYFRKTTFYSKKS